MTPLIYMMDDQDEYGIPSDYYQYFSETPQHYSENVPTSSFDDLLDEALAERSFEDFGEYMRVTWVSLLYVELIFMHDRAILFSGNTLWRPV